MCSSDLLKGLLPMDLIDIVAEAGLHYDPARLRGSVFHLLGCLSEFGKLGLTSIGRNDEEARAVYGATVERLLAGAQQRREASLARLAWHGASAQGTISPPAKPA